jgi:hypothetical protein
MRSTRSVNSACSDCGLGDLRGIVPSLTTATFDATTVDPATIRFGAAGTEASPVEVKKTVVDRDRVTDLLVRFKMGDTAIRCGATAAVLKARTFSGVLIEGTDSIKTVNCK